MSKRLVLAGLAAAVVLSPLAVAAQGRAPKPPAQLTISNMRTDPLVVLVVQTAGETPKIVGTLRQGLAPGKSAKLALKGAKGCSYNVLARFADGTETEARTWTSAPTRRSA